MTAAPTSAAPTWWLDRLGRRLTERAGRATFTRVGRRDDVGTDRRLVDATGMALYQAYYEGRHRETYKIRRVIEAFGLRMPIYVNYAGVVVDSISERLGVDGFTFGGDDRASEAAWAIWQDNNLDAGFKRGMRSGLIKGEFSLVLWPDEDWSPRIWVEDGAEVITSVHPETGVRRAALKRWTDEDEPGAMFANLFLPDAVYKYRTPATPRARRRRRRRARDPRRHGLGAPDRARASRGRCPTRSAWCRSSRSPTSPTSTSSASPSSARSCRSRTRSTPTSRTSCWPGCTGPSARRSCSTSRSRSTRPPAPRSSRSTSRSTR